MSSGAKKKKGNKSKNKNKNKDKDAATKAKERKKREKERAKRDQENARKRLERKSKEQRRKILQIRRMQTRFVLPNINQLINTDKNTNISSQNSPSDQVQQNDNKTDPASTNDTNIDQTNTNIDDNKDADNKSDDNKSDDNNNTLDIDQKDNDNKNDVITIIDDNKDDMKLLKLSDQQEEDINILELAFEEYDGDYYGFIEYDKFLSILKQNKINLTNKQETFLMIALTLIDDGVDYYGFLKLLRNKAAVSSDFNLTKICQQMAIDAEKQANDAAVKQNNINQDQKNNDDIEIDQDELNKFYAAAQNARSRGMNLVTMARTSTIIPQTNKIRQIIEQFALDEPEVDYAVLKTALAEINCNPPDRDLIFLINYLAHKDDDINVDNNDINNVIEYDMDDDDLFIDFNYFLSFCQEVSNIPVINWRNPQKIIQKVANQTRMVYRTQLRRKNDKIKLKKRLEKRKNAKNNKGNKHQKELKDIEAEEKRIRALKLREKAKNLSKSNYKSTNTANMSLKAWITKRSTKNSKKTQKELRKWMEKNNIFNKHLFNELIASNNKSLDDLKKLTQLKLDKILRKVRADRFADIKNQSSRNKLDKLLVNFEKKWRKLSKEKNKKITKIDINKKKKINKNNKKLSNKKKKKKK